MGFCVVRSTGLGNAKAFVERNGQQVQTPALFSYMYKTRRSFNTPFVREFANEARRNPASFLKRQEGTVRIKYVITSV